ncbi:MAG TPA: biotin/lipoyl-containing protein, partial [Streptosporangiaceae bacterium]|nr:biotin/lipoyl-containing protein [Streptosporangiaceae bacterium]
DDVADILALLDSLPYDELDLETPRFRLTLRRTPDGWTQSTQVLSAPDPLAAPESAPASAAPAGAAPEVKGPPPPSIGGKGPFTPVDGDGNGVGEADEAGGIAERGEGEGGEEDVGLVGLVAVRAPLPGTFYRAPRPGAAPFVEVGSRVGADTVIGIVETMKLMNSVPAGVAGVVAEFCVANAEFAAQGAALLRIRADQ